MKYILLLITLAGYLAAQTIHSSASTYIETKTFTSSVQKENSILYGVGGDIHYGASAFKLAYEHGDTKTKQPPLKDDLHTDKLFLRYVHTLNENFKVNLNYLSVLKDNIAPTDGGVAYGLGLTYMPSKSISTNFTQYMTNYSDFDVLQSDFKLDYKFKLNAFKIKISSITKYITIDEKNRNSFTKFADDEYLTTALKVHAHYNSFHFGAGAYYGKRVFAVMRDGFKLQHHAMEFDRTYALGIGKNFSDFVLRFQYIYQRAEELPAHNENVEVQNLRFIANYKF